MSNKFGATEIIQLFKELEKQINDLWCFVERCCEKIPINVGNGIGIYRRFKNNKWEFKSLIAGDNVTITETDTEITINSSGGGGSFNCNDLIGCPVSNLTNDSGYITCSEVNTCLTGSPTEMLYFDALGNVSSDVNFYRTNSDTLLKQVGNLGENSYLYLTPTTLELFSDASGVGDGGSIELNLTTALLGKKTGNIYDSYLYSVGSSTGWYSAGSTFVLPLSDGNNGDVMTTDGAGNVTFQPASGGGLITAIADTNTINLTETVGTLTADVNYQNTATINLSEDASGLKADFASMDISQFTNDSGYTTNTGTVTSVGLTTGTTGTDVNVTGSPVTGSGTITLNIPTASATNRGVLNTSDWSNFDRRTVFYCKSTAPNTTTSATEVIMDVYAISANTLNIYDVLSIMVGARIERSAGTPTIRIGISTSAQTIGNAPVSGTTVSTFAATATRNGYVKRNFKITNSTTLDLLIQDTAAFSDNIISNSGTVNSTATIDRTNIIYMYVSMQMGTAGDVGTLKDFSIARTKGV